MAKIEFSDVKLRNLSPPNKGQATYWDAKLPTFGLRISQGGSKTFILKRQNSFITIGRFPIPLSLAEGRTEARRLLAEFTLGRVRPQSIAFPQAVALFLEDKAKNRRSRTVRDYARLLGRLGFKGQLADLNRPELERLLKRFTAPAEYNHVLVAVKVFFGWALKRHYVENDPTTGFSVHSRPARSRVLTDEELGRIWRACEQHRSTENGRGVLCAPERDVNDATKPLRSLLLPANFARIVQLLILTGARRGEIVALQSSWITLNSSLRKDLPTSSAICLPSNVCKNSREHLFPIGPLAAFLLKPLLDASQSSLLFPGRGKNTPFNGWSKSKAALDKISGVSNWTLHDIRRTYRTIHARIGTPPHIAERLVNHVSSRSAVEVIYDRHTYLPEMRIAVENYERFLQSIGVGRNPSADPREASLKEPSDVRRSG